jgi:hypothetical protein
MTEVREITRSELILDTAEISRIVQHKMSLNEGFDSNTA